MSARDEFPLWHFGARAATTELEADARAVWLAAMDRIDTLTAENAELKAEMDRREGIFRQVRAELRSLSDRLTAENAELKARLETETNELAYDVTKAYLVAESWEWKSKVLAGELLVLRTALVEADRKDVDGVLPPNLVALIPDGNWGIE